MSKLRQRRPPPEAEAGNAESKTGGETHPAGKIKHGRPMQLLRGLTFIAYFLSCCTSILATQIIGAPLYFVNRKLYDAYMALTKQSFGLLITTMTNWWGPTTIRISGDASVAGQIRKTSDGRVEFSFPERMVLIANHQLYTDWLYLWWVGYANAPQMHGYIYIILKESLRYIPILGPGMMFYGFIFMSRKMAVDQPRLAHRLGRLKTRHTSTGADGIKTSRLDPMWLLLFPEGTNASQNGRDKSAKWAAKIGVDDMRHTLMPRITGMFFCLNQLKGTVEYVYDCTVAYEGIPRGKFGEDYFSLSSTYFEGRPPKSVNFYWRRFRLADMPLHDHNAFDAWLRARWSEKDALMEQYLTTGRFPPSPFPLSSSGDGAGVVDVAKEEGFVETEVRTRYWFEFLQIFVVLAISALVWNIVSTAWPLKVTV